MVIKRFLAPIILTVVLAIGATLAFSADAKIIAYYFHGNVRCPTCHKMEQYTKEAIEENFKNELANGLLVVKTVNVEEKGNEHFVNDYQLYTKSLIISRVENGKEIRHKNLTKIWEYVRDKRKFFNYVTTEINNYLKDNQ
ncbi:MAG: nitrophenyl compound nitroreductase subunit ArsF family protein [Candidatus Omnitrophota bacterium]